MTKVSQSKSREQASKIFNVGTTYIQQVKKLKSEGKEKELAEIRAGTNKGVVKLPNLNKGRNPARNKLETGRALSELLK